MQRNLAHLHRLAAVVLTMTMQWFSSGADAADYAAERARMVQEHIASRDVRDPRVLDAMRKTPRERFVPEKLRSRAYDDSPLPIGEGQTISQPYIVALMTELAQPRASDKALEIGTGSGYQAAVLAPLVAHVYTIELEPALGRTAAQVLHDLHYDNVTTRIGDGYAGWPEHAPFDIIIVTAAPDHVPEPLIEQLKPGGRMIIPVGRSHSVQHLQVIEKAASGQITTRDVAPVMFVPLRREQD